MNWNQGTEQLSSNSLGISHMEEESWVNSPLSLSDRHKTWTKHNSLSAKGMSILGADLEPIKKGPQVGGYLRVKPAQQNQQAMLSAIRMGRSRAVAPSQGAHIVSRCTYVMKRTGAIRNAHTAAFSSEHLPPFCRRLQEIHQMVTAGNIQVTFALSTISHLWTEILILRKIEAVNELSHCSIV